MRVAAVQFTPTFGDVRGNLERARELVAWRDADLYVLPELALSGYIFESRSEALSLAQDPGGGEFDRLAAAASKQNAAIVIGFAERSADTVYNSSLLLAPDGSRSVYRKIHLFADEKRIFEPGDCPPHVVEVAGKRLGMMICFDWIFPETARTLALLGADIICHPANLVLTYCQDAMVTRCLENKVFAITANRAGAEDRAGQSLTFTGQSEIVSPGGDILAKAGSDSEEVIVADIDPSRARVKTVTPVNDVLTDRRPGLYRLG
jgi:predicted amidohydrolase